jgi:hypothetical protein
MHVKAVNGRKGVVPVKRMVLLCCLIALVVCGALPAYAHTLSLVAAVSNKGNVVSVQQPDRTGRRSRAARPSPSRCCPAG